MVNAIITNTIKKDIINRIMNDANDPDNTYYVAVGRSEDWNDSDAPPRIYNSGREERNFRHSIQSIKNITDISMVVPRYNWASGAIYSAYDDAQVGYPAQPYYVINNNNQIYLCVQQARNSAGAPIVSTAQPAGNTDGTPFQTSDGYIWKFLYSISALDAAKFISGNFMPVKFQGEVDSDSLITDVEQLAVQDAAVEGQVTGVVLDSGGAGYTTIPTVSIVGDGFGAEVLASISGGQVTKFELRENTDGTFKLGRDYTEAVITLTGGGSFTKPAKGRVIITNNQIPGGLGADPRDDLRSTAIMFNSKPDGDEEGDFIVDQDFRQIGLLKNPKVDSDNGTEFTGSTGQGLKKLVFSSVTHGFTADNTIIGSTSQVKALIDRVDSSNVWYHQTEATGFGDFDSGEAVSETDGNGAGTLDADHAPFTAPEFNPKTGELMYVSNHNAVARNTSQTEDIKIVIQI